MKGAKSPEYRIWQAMLARCKKHPRYAGRGINVCDEWKKDFARFLADMGPRPSEKHSIDRGDNDGPYAPWNCSWKTQKEQMRNQARNRPVRRDDGLVFGTIAEAAEVTGANKASIRAVCLGVMHHTQGHSWTFAETAP
jgi:hypothetical protein